MFTLFTSCTNTIYRHILICLALYNHFYWGAFSQWIMPKEVNLLAESKKKFMDLFEAGKVTMRDIEKFIEEWHNSDSKESLYDFLGMTHKEYNLWFDNGYRFF